MNPLGDLLREQRDRLADRGDNIAKIADRAGLAQSVIYHHLSRYEPFKQTPRQGTLRKLARGFQLDPAQVIAAAREATGPAATNPLQALLSARKADLDVTLVELAQRAAKGGHPISPASLSNILSGKHTNLEDDTIRAVAAGFDLSLKDVREAARQSRAKVTYRLPAHLEEQLTPEKWRKIVAAVEALVKIEE